jgi:methylenetetrahydrofolate dehydrogenase (NADP+)/methenyltetrahydrofolate cyclohydrolase
VTARIIDGKALAARVKDELKVAVDGLRRRGRLVRLDAVLAGGDPSASVYATNQASACRALGIEHALHQLPASASHGQVEALVARLNTDPTVHAIMVHLPLPPACDTEQIQSRIAPDKDVEGVNPVNIGNVVYGRRSLLPCTALAVMEMIESTGVALPGTNCVCVGASNIVGKPIVVLLMRSEATVISTNKYTKNLSELTRGADVLISAAGHAGLITADMVKPGAIVIDVGISRQLASDGMMRTVGDVDERVRQVAAWVSPVPGGVGPMTVAMLLRNTVDSARRALEGSP